MLTAFACAGSAAAAAELSEYVTGDLSGDPAQPTLFALTPGANTLVASTGASDLDVLRIVVPPNHVLDTILIQFHEGLSRVFTGVQPGVAWTAGVGGEIDPSGMLGWIDFPVNPSHSHSGVDILADMGQAPGAIGFTGALGAGDYTFLFQSASSIMVPFALDFRVSAASSGGLSADFNRDGVVNGADLTQWRQAFGGASNNADANADGVSDGADMLLWQRQYGQRTAAIPIPEPRAAVMTVLAIAGVVARRRQAGRYRPACGLGLRCRAVSAARLRGHDVRPIVT